MFKNVVKEEITIPAQMPYLRQLRDFIEDIGHKFNFNQKIVNSFKLVVDEACTNIIRHGYRDIKNGKITCRAIIRRLSLTIVIIDNGKSFDPRQVQDPDLNKYVSIGKKGGLGIFMMRKLMDDIKYNVTSRGNELRLTKTREKVERAKPLMVWESLTIRTKFSLVTSVILTVVIIASFILFNSRIQSKITAEVFREAQNLSENLARMSWEPMNDSKEIPLYENSKSIQESNPDMIRMALITDAESKTLATYPVKRDMMGKQLRLKDKDLIQRVKRTEISHFKITPESAGYAFINPIILPGTNTQPLGYAHIWISEDYMQDEINTARINLIILLFIILIVGNGGSFILITLIMDPFHKLASWVRQVGHGTVDEDELDIDASDELGEIAQAFNEMTGKFREAQINLMEQQRIQRELQVAQEIQQMLLPNDFPNVVGYDITSYYQAAKEVGGDLFDFVEVDDHTIGICVADVSGKGVPGSMVMTMIRTALRLESRGNKNPAHVLAKVNEFVTDDIRKGMFVTSYYIILDSRERMISFASAGHNPMILYRGKAKETFYLNPPGFPVGITLPDIHLFDNTIKADRIRLHPDDILIVYTDGITEAMNSQRELYGDERFLAAIRKYGHLDVVDFVNNIKQDILEFTGGYEQSDDITLVAVKENMEAVDVKIETFKNLFELAEKSDMTISQACKEMDISPSTYYKYKKIYDDGGYDYLREMLHGYTNVGLRHLSVEIKTKLYDIIREHAEYGPKRISEELNTEKYGFLDVPERLIYEELKRAKLNHRVKRERFVKRGGKRRLKPPGTPLLTLDGEVMIGFRSEDMEDKIPKIFSVKAPVEDPKTKERILTIKRSQQESAEEVEEEIEQENKIENPPLPENGGIKVDEEIEISSDGKKNDDIENPPLPENGGIKVDEEIEISSDGKKNDDNEDIVPEETNKKERSVD
jgi:serine phosphatase RsbU (regulator of sigma subunit)/anti-sigma regulatory factor (Ser/Thr protein kinase)